VLRAITFATFGTLGFWLHSTPTLRARRHVLQELGGHLKHYTRSTFGVHFGGNFGE
jgi:hypothetical protein